MTSGAVDTALARIKAIVGPSGWLSEPADTQPYERDERGLLNGRALMVVRPKTTAEVAQVIHECAQARLPVIPQGGNTGLVGGSGPYGAEPAILLSLTRMTALRSLDAANFTLSVDAGCTLATVQKAAQDIDRLFPLSLGAEGTCTIGGTIATNAGGIQVLRYGTMRDLVLGLEVVLPDGRVVDAMRGLRKDNTGYDLKQLFIGAEGTLGVITGAVLKLFPNPRDICTAFVAVPDPAAAVALLEMARAASSDTLNAFELMSRFTLDAITRHTGLQNPLGTSAPWFVLLEIASGGSSGAGARDLVERCLDVAMARGLVSDGTIADSLSQRQGLWRLRESTWPAQCGEGASIKHDVSVPVSSVADFLAAATPALELQVPGARVFAFGHVGDGNIHFNLAQPPGETADAFMGRESAVHDTVHALVARYHGSISAEHGIGRVKIADLPVTKSHVELALMKQIKQAVDPLGIMNPGVLFPVS